MAIVGVASIRIKPDLTKFRRELKDGLTAIKAELQVNVSANTRPAREQIDAFVARESSKDIHKKVEVDTSTLDKAKKAFKGFSQGAAGLVAGLTSASFRVVKFGILLSAASAALVSSAHLVGGLTTAVASMGPALAAVGIGGLLTLVGGFVAVKLGIDGIHKALDGLNKPISNLRTAVSKSFESALLPAVNNVKVVIPQLTSGFQQIATAIGGAATRFAAMLKTGQNVGLLKTILSEVARSIQSLGVALAPLGHAFLEVGAVAAKVFRGITQSLAVTATGFADKISAKAESGALESSFKRSISNVKEFFRVLKDVGSGIANIFKAVSSGFGGGGAGTFLDILSTVSAKFKEFTASATGQQVFKDIGSVIGILAGAFHSLLSALEPVLPILGDVAKVIGTGLADVITQLAPLIATVATDFLNMAKDVVPKLMPVIEKLASAFLRILDAVIPLVSPIADLVIALVPLIDPLVRLVEAILPPLVSLFTALKGPIDIVAKSLAGLLELAGPVGDALFTLIANGIGLLLGQGNDVKTAGKTGGLQKAFKDAASGASKSFGDGLESGGTAGVTRFGAAVQKAMTGDVKSQFAVAAAGTATAGGSAFNAEFSKWLSFLPGQTAAQIVAILNIFSGTEGKFSAEGNKLGSLFSSGIDSGGNQALSIAQSIVDDIISIFSGKPTAAERAGADISNALAGGLSSGKGAIGSTAQQIADTVIFAIGGVSLYGTGISIVDSLSAGMRSAVNTVKTVLSFLTSMIPVWKGPPDTDAKLLTPAGVSIMQSLINGVESKQGDLQATLASVTAQFQSLNTDSGGLAATMSSSLLVGGDIGQTPVNVNVGVNEGPLKNFIEIQIDGKARNTRRQVKAGVS